MWHRVDPIGLTTGSVRRRTCAPSVVRGASLLPLDALCACCSAGVQRRRRGADGDKASSRCNSSKINCKENCSRLMRSYPILARPQSTHQCTVVGAHRPRQRGAIEVTRRAMRAATQVIEVCTSTTPMPLPTRAVAQDPRVTPSPPPAMEDVWDAIIAGDLPRFKDFVDQSAATVAKMVSTRTRRRRVQRGYSRRRRRRHAPWAPAPRAHTHPSRLPPSARRA